MKIRFLHHLLVPVSDLERAAQFYTELGMERMERMPSNNPITVWMQFGPNQLHLWKNDELHTYNGWNHEPSPHFAIEGDDIWEYHRRIPEIGGQILQGPKQRPHDNSWYLFALDPDGNRFEVTQH